MKSDRRKESVKIDKLDPQPLGDFGAEVGIVGDDCHREALRAPRDLRADPAESDYAERLPVDLRPEEAVAFPLATPEVGVGLRKLPGDGEEERHRVLGGGDRVAARRVHANDAAPRGGLHVDVVKPDPGAADHLESRSGVDHLGRDPRRAPDHETRVRADSPRELLGRKGRHHVDQQAFAAKRLDAYVLERVGDENPLRDSVAHRRLSLP